MLAEKKGHYASRCGKYKKSPPANNFVSYFNISILAEPNINMVVECLVDSGSPISLVRECLVPGRVKLQEEKCIYYGLNMSELKIVGKTKCNIEVLNKHVLIELMVVPNESVGCPVVLGRNFITASNAKLKIGSVEFMNQSENTGVENYCEGHVENVKENDNNVHKEIDAAIREILTIEVQDANKVEYVIGHEVSASNKNVSKICFTKSIYRQLNQKCPWLKKRFA